MPDDGVQQWSIEDRPLEVVRAGKLRVLSGERGARCARFAYDGEPDAYADSAITAVTGAVFIAQLAPPDGPQVWKLSPMAVRQWETSDLIAYGAAIRAHIQTQFDHEALIMGLILDAETVAQLDAIDVSAGWPG